MRMDVTYSKGQRGVEMVVDQNRQQNEILKITANHHGVTQNSTVKGLLI